ncbi:reticulon-1 isoform X1 [Rhinatrema bivittatum]|uniref:reticulon-1 isoform X1 n=1 Tax=Rhinatrema bivittatum TaxID=194408 RepID=UPI0011261E76|nr:reticulon-1 isoform X1 [Rhinatrema bivittatum]
MSANPENQSGSGAGWLAEELGLAERFERSSASRASEKQEVGARSAAAAAAAGGSSSTDCSWKEGAQLLVLQPGKDQQLQHPPVAMETTSTDYADASRITDHDSARMPVGREGAFYTSLISGDNYSSQQDSTYFTGILKEETNNVICLGNMEEFNIAVCSPQDVPIFESHGLFSSDSGIEMTPAESTDVNKILAYPSEQDKVEAYKYMDISRSEEIKYQDTSGISLEDKRTSFVDKYPELTNFKNLSKTEEVKDHQFSERLTSVPYLEEPFNEAGLYTTSAMKESQEAPVKIHLTETETTNEPYFQENSLSTQGLSLKPGPDIVPTVTVSEPEDDSPGSLTPPSTDTEPSGSENQNKYSISEDELLSAIKAKEGGKGFSFETSEDQQSPGIYPEKQELRSAPRLPSLPSALDNEGSSADSGDSEIELVSEDQFAAEEAMHSTYMTFSHIGGPPPSPASPSIQYSILREEREAELDSELIIESCDGSSASEESPKREQDSPLMKPIIMDIIQEENGSRSENLNASEFEVSKAMESKLNKENLAESAAYLKCSFAVPELKVAPLLEANTKELKRTGTQKKPVDTTACNQNIQNAKDFGRKSPITSPSLPFLNKKKAIDLLYWRDIKQTGIVFGSVLLLLFSLTQFSVVSVIAYLALAALSATISFRIYKSVLQAVQKTDEGHPFKAYLEMEISLSQDQIQKYTECIQQYVNSTVRELRRLFLVQDLVDSLKFAVLMWLLTYVGALFNGLTLLIMAVVSMFSLPAVYDKYQAQIDQYLGLVRTHMNTVMTKIQAKIPGAKRRTE